MGTRQTLDVLSSYAALLGECGDQRSADAVHALVSALSSAGEAGIKTTVAKVAKIRANSPETMVSPIGYGSRLRALARLLVAGGAKAVGGDIELLSPLLEGGRPVDAGEFEQALRSAILASPAPKKVSRKQKREPLSKAEVRLWADRLTATTADQTEFEAVLSEIDQIPGLSVPDLRSIAECYLGHEAPKSKKGILQKIRSRQMQDAIEAGRQSRIQRIAV